MPRRSRRVIKDWVANRYTYAGIDASAITMTPGLAGQVALPLTISDQARNLAVGNTADEVGWGAIPEGWGPRTYAVRGFILYASETSEVAATCKARITVHAMDYDTLAALTPGSYTIAQDPPAVSQSADEPFCWEDVMISPTWGGVYIRQKLDVKCRANRRLENNEALYLVLEMPENTGNMNLWINLRTLVAVE